MAIRILHVVEAFGVGGGVETGVANLTAHMDSTRFEHVLCGIFRVGPLMDRYPRDRVQIVSLQQSGKKFSTQVVPIATAIRQIRPDVVHSRNWGAMEAVLAARWVGSCSVIHSEHGVEMNPAAEPLRRRWFRRAVFRFADRVFSVSHQLRDMLAERTGIPASDISVIHNGVDTGRFSIDAAMRRTMRAELGIADDEFSIGCVGRLSAIKDYPTILRAVEVFNESCAKWRLFIVGEGTELAALQTMVNTTPSLAGRVHFLGTTNRVQAFLSAMDTYALPSVCEGISNSLLEAMAAGVPVVATNVGGNPEVVINNESGLLFDVGDFRALADRLAMLQKHTSLRQRLGQQARERIQAHFSLEVMVRNYENLYETATAARAHGRNIGAALCGAEKVS